MGCYTIAVAVLLSAIETARRTKRQRAFVDEPLPDRLITDGIFRWMRHRQSQRRTGMFIPMIGRG